MKCPECGNEIKDGKLYCEKCGQEIRMVPDFEPEIEIEMEETLMNVAEDLANSPNSKTQKLKSIFVTDSKKTTSLIEDEMSLDDDNEEQLDYQEDDDSVSDDFWDVNEAIDFSKGADAWHKFVHLLKKSMLARVLTAVLAIALVAVICVACIFISKVVQNNSFDYQVKQAMSYSDTGDYAKAIEYLERAISIDSDQMKTKLTLADLYRKNNQTENAILMLQEIIAYNDENVQTAYEKLFEIYSSENRFEDIHLMLVACNDDAIKERFQEYLALPPEFGLEEGKYNEVQHLKLTSNTAGTIYYTVDGVLPDTNSNIYSSPIYLETGCITVRAFFVNNYGLASEVITKRYEIDVLVPDAPVIRLESGEYTLPDMIIVEAPEDCVVYYTTDGTDPTTESEVYREPMCMPLGTMNYSFTCINEEGIASEVIYRQYTLTIESTVSAAEAANMVTNYRFSLGGLTDTEGHLVTVAGRLMYLCQGAVTIGGEAYYFIGEYYEDPVTLLQTKTGLQYGVNVNTGTIISMELDEFGYYYAVEIVSQQPVQ